MRGSFLLIAAFLASFVPRLGLTADLRVSGQSSFVCHFYDQVLFTSQKTNGYHMEVSPSRVNLEIVGASETLGGLDYSLLFAISGDANLDKSIIENRILLHKDWVGSVLLGNTKGVDELMSVGAHSILGGMGGFIGPYHKVLNRSNGVVLSRNLVGSSKHATKATYLTPRVGGLQLGITLTPNTEHIGEALPSPHVSVNLPAQPYDTDQVGLGLSYQQTFKNGFWAVPSKVDFSGTFLSAKTMRGIHNEWKQKSDLIAQRFDTRSYALGAILQWKDLQIAGEFIDHGRSHIRKDVKGRNAGQACDLAISYSRGNSNLSFSWYGSTRQIQASNSYDGDEFIRAEGDVWSLAYDYKLSRAPCVLIYAEVDLFDFQTDNKLKRTSMITNNKLESTGNMSNMGHVYLIGSRVKF